MRFPMAIASEKWNGGTPNGSTQLWWRSGPPTDDGISRHRMSGESLPGLSVWGPADGADGHWTFALGACWAVGEPPESPMCIVEGSPCEEYAYGHDGESLITPTGVWRYATPEEEAAISAALTKATLAIF